MFWSVLSDEQKRNLMIIGGIGLVLILGAGAFLIASHTSGPADPEPGMREVAEAERKKDARKLSETVHDADERKAAAAVGSLARVGGSEYRSVVQGAMRDPRVQVRKEAIAWYPRVANWRNPADIGPLTDAVKGETDTDVVVATLKSLGHMKAWDSLGLIFEKMNDTDRSVRMAAGLAAEEILFLRVFPKYQVDDPPEKRLAAIQEFRSFSREKGRRERYFQWLAEEQQKQQK